MTDILLGFSEVFQIWNLMSLLLGVLLGIVIGFLPGMNDNIAFAVFIPITFGMDPQIAMMIMVGIYCSTSIGGSFPAILLKIPGTASSVVTALDGYPMTQKNQGGLALGIATISSVFGGIISAILLITMAPFLAEQALKFGPVEYFSLTILGLSTVVGMARDNMLKNIISTILGLIIATFGMSPQSGFPRFTFGSSSLMEGIPLVPLLIGLFGIVYIFEMGKSKKEKVTQTTKKAAKSITKVLPSFKMLKQLFPVMSVSALIGSFIGIMPGAGMVMGIYIAYDRAVSMYKDKKFGTGVPEGVAAPESANNAVVASSMVPLVSLGIPGNSVSALFLGALMIHGLTPGPSLFEDNPEVAYLLVVGFFVAYIFALPIGLLAAKFASTAILKIPQSILGGIVILLCTTGAFSVRNNLFDVGLAIIIGLLAYCLMILEIPFSPLILAVILGPIIEKSFQQSLVLSEQSLLIFIQQPISLVLLIIALLFLLKPLYDYFKIKVTQVK